MNAIDLGPNNFLNEKYHCHIIITIMLLVACGTSRPYQEIIATSAETEPIWLQNEQTICPTNFLCSLGETKKQTSQSKAIDSARKKAYAQLLSAALPSDIETKLIVNNEFETINGKTLTKSHVKEQIEEVVLGRLTGVKGIDTYWQSRYDYGLKGKIQVYDAWVLLGIPKDVLENAWEQEMTRAISTLNKAHEVLDPIDITAIRKDPLYVLDTLKLTIESIGTIVRVPEHIKVISKINNIIQIFQGELKISVVEKHTVDRSKIIIEVKSSINEKAISSLSLKLNNHCDNQEMQEIKLNQNGICLVEFHRDSPFKICNVKIIPKDHEYLMKNLTLPAKYDSLELHPHITLSGFYSNDLNSYIVQRLQQIYQKTKREQKTADIDVYVSGNLSSPRKVSGRLIGAGGIINFTAKLPDGIVMYQTDLSVRGVGNGRDQLKISLGKNLTEFVFKNLSDAKIFSVK
jgi:hypothetical protein